MQRLQRPSALPEKKLLRRGCRHRRAQAREGVLLSQQQKLRHRKKDGWLSLRPEWKRRQGEEREEGQQGATASRAVRLLFFSRELRRPLKGKERCSLFQTAQSSRPCKARSPPSTRILCGGSRAEEQVVSLAEESGKKASPPKKGTRRTLALLRLCAGAALLQTRRKARWRRKKCQLPLQPLYLQPRREGALRRPQGGGLAKTNFSEPCRRRIGRCIKDERSL